VGSESRGVTGTSHVADDQFLIGKPEMELGLESAEVDVAFGESIADQDDAFADGRGTDGLRPDLGGRGWQFGGGVRAIVRLRGPRGSRSEQEGGDEGGEQTSGHGRIMTAEGHPPQVRLRRVDQNLPGLRTRMSVSLATIATFGKSSEESRVSRDSTASG